MLFPMGELMHPVQRLLVQIGWILCWSGLFSLPFVLFAAWKTRHAGPAVPGETLVVKASAYRATSQTSWRASARTPWVLAALCASMMGAAFDLFRVLYRFFVLFESYESFWDAWYEQPTALLARLLCLDAAIVLVRGRVRSRRVSLSLVLTIVAVVVQLRRQSIEGPWMESYSLASWLDCKLYTLGFVLTALLLMLARRALSTQQNTSSPSLIEQNSQAV